MLRILYEDSAILVVEKPPGMESQSARGFEPDMVSEIRNYLHKSSTVGGEPYVGVIHRLDKPVGGTMVYAKTPKAAAHLSRQLQSHQMRKEYLAVICGEPVDKSGTFVDNLWKDPRANQSYLVDKGDKRGKRAELSYRVLETAQMGDGTASLARIWLVTGRHHQIRAQFAGHGYPLWGDRKYGTRGEPGIPSPPGSSTPWDRKYGTRGEPESGPALWAFRLTFLHPGTELTCTYQTEPIGEVWKKFQFHHGQGNGAII